MADQTRKQVRIAEGDNTSQYWPNLGSQQSAIVIGPVLPFASVKCWADDGGLCWLFKFTDLQSKLRPVSALYQADCHFYYGILLGQVPFLPWQTILKMGKPDFGTASARCWEKYLIISGEPCSQKKGQILAQQWPIISSQVCFTTSGSRPSWSLAWTLGITQNFVLCKQWTVVMRRCYFNAAPMLGITQVLIGRQHWKAFCYKNCLITRI